MVERLGDNSFIALTTKMIEIFSWQWIYIYDNKKREK